MCLRDRTSILLIPIDDFDFVGRVETLDQDLGRILKQLSGEQESHGSSAESQGADGAGKEKINPIFSNATGAGSKQAFYYEPESIELVQKLYQRDFELLRYPTEF